jgi:hypothetical protein
MGVGFDSGFDSGLSGFDVTMTELLSLLPAQRAGLKKAWNLAGLAMRKVHYRLLKIDSDTTRRFNELTPDYALRNRVELHSTCGIGSCSRVRGT